MELFKYSSFAQTLLDLIEIQKVAIPLDLSLCLLVSLLITFTNSLDQDQAQQNIGSDLVPNCLTLSCYFLKNLIRKINFERI